MALVMTYRLGDVPNSLWGDEGGYWTLARDIARGQVTPDVFGLGVYAFPMGGSLYQAAWLNVFLLLGEIRAITACAGAVAVGMALINIKDFFHFRQGVTLSIPEHAKPGPFRRMRGLMTSGNPSVLLLGTIVANWYGWEWWVREAAQSGP